MNPEEIIQSFESGERDLEPLLEKMGWKSWLGVAELGLIMGSEIVEFLESKLSPAETKVLELVKMRLSGEINLESIEDALTVSRTPETRDLGLEGRLRMERGLMFFEMGEIEKARDDITWAETRLKSVAKASRDHDISLLNKAAFHISIDEPMMALHVHGEISRNAGHAHETIAISRVQASRIHLAFGQFFDAARCAFNSHAHAIIANQIDLAIEAGAIFVEIGSSYIDDEADNFSDQIVNSKPLSAGEEQPMLRINSADINGVLEWCVENTDNDYSGLERPDLRALILLAKKLDRIDLFDDLLQNPSIVGDALLAAMCASVSEGELKELWTSRVTEIMTLEDI